MGIKLNENNSITKYCLTIIISIGYVIVAILGLLFDGEMFLFIFPAYTAIETIIVNSLFRKENGVKSENVHSSS